MNKRSREEYDTEIGVIICGLPGKMGLEIADACIRRGYTILPIGLTVRPRSSEVSYCFL